MRTSKLCVVVGFFAIAGVLQAGPKAFERESTTLSLWDFSEGSGTSYDDDGPGKFDMLSSQVEGFEPPVWTKGKFEHALLFEGQSRLEQKSVRPPLKVENEVTVEAWIKLPAKEPKLGMGILQYGAAGTEGFRLGVETTGELVWLVSNTDGEKGVHTRSKLPVDKWIHVAGTYDGKVAKIYLNGDLENELEFTEGAIQGKGDLLIGYFSGGARPPFTGEISAIRISNKALAKFKTH